MVTVVYVDILIIFNTLVNYLIILATAFFTSERKRRGRIALSAFLCSGLSLIVLVPNIGEVLLVVIKLLGATVMAGAAFGFKGIKRLSRNAIYVFISSYPSHLFRKGAVTGTHRKDCHTQYVLQ